MLFVSKKKQNQNKKTLKKTQPNPPTPTPKPEKSADQRQISFLQESGMFKHDFCSCGLSLKVN